MPVHNAEAGVPRVAFVVNDIEDEVGKICAGIKVYGIDVFILESHAILSSFLELEILL